ncbi:MAG: haloacid dehalogenase-like hydrolase [Rhodobacteraceae bacterium HLUCCA08]|nr:MAG: haloacid dehalogenase-like hydrolase [Rhodobacteraceae bacterium HLUCCA08]
MARKHVTVAICYDFDGTLSPGYMQNYSFIPKLGMKPSAFWAKVKVLAKDQDGDEILIYMGQMLREADHAGVSVKRESFSNFGGTIELFDGVKDWFDRINRFGREREVSVEHYIVSSGLREMIEGTEIAEKFKKIYASGFWYDHEGVAKFPALGVNYTTKTQFLFRINKGVLDVWDKDKVNKYVAPKDRPVPFSNMVFLGDGDTDIPCFRLVKDLGGHSIAVYRPKAKKFGAKAVADRLLEEGRVNFSVPANYTEGSELDKAIKAVISKVSTETELWRLGKRY